MVVVGAVVTIHVAPVTHQVPYDERRDVDALALDQVEDALGDVQIAEREAPRPARLRVPGEFHGDLLSGGDVYT